MARWLGWAAVVLDDHPDQRAELAADPGLIPATVEELLRYEAPSPVQGRWTTRPVELHGVTIPERSKVLLITGSAGRDERQYPHAERFDVHRPIDQHVSFGHGIHFCLGAALARLGPCIGWLRRSGVPTCASITTGAWLCTLGRCVAASPDEVVWHSRHGVWSLTALRRLLRHGRAGAALDELATAPSGSPTRGESGLGEHLLSLHAHRRGHGHPHVWMQDPPGGRSGAPVGRRLARRPFPGREASPATTTASGR